MTASPDSAASRGASLRRAMFGTELPHHPVTESSAAGVKLEQMVTEYCFGDLWQRREIDLKTRSMVTVAMLVALGRPRELRVHLQGALSNGATASELREIALQASLYCGIPASLEGLRAIDDVLPPETLPNDE